MTEEEKKKKKKSGENPVEEPTPMQELEEAHKQEMSDLQAVNEQKYKDIGDILGEAEQKLGELKVQDEDAQRRSEKYRYISGIGDALSGLANLVGTAHGASNQQQTYNSNMIAQKAEQSRKERKVEMDTLSTRLDEMRARAKDIKSAGSLAEAELKSKHSRERLEQRISDDKLAREKMIKDRELALKQYEAETARIKAEKETPQKPAKPDNPLRFDLVGGERIEIPSYNWNKAALSAVYSVIPDELKTRRARREKDPGGRYVDVKDAAGNIVHYTPTEQEMLNDIIAAAKQDENVANALRSYVTGKGANDPDFDD